MNDRERLEAIVKVVRQYLPPDGISIKEAMGKIIELVDPMDEDQYWGKLSEEHLHALKKDMRAKAKKYMEEISVVIEVKDDKPPVKSYCGGVPNYCTPEETPEVTPEVTGDVDAVNISAERVDETAKDRHKFEEMVKKGTKAWDGTPDDWVDDLRGGADKQEPDDIYDVWKEKNNG